MTANPTLVEVKRGDAIESYHRGAYAVVDSSGALLHSRGDIERFCYARSAIKPLQAIAFLESGAVERFSLRPTHIALACSSHNSEPRHVGLVQQWLSSLQLAARDLECGGHLPYHEDSRDQLLRSGGEFDATYNNCSGKHTAMLSTAKTMNEPTQGYIDPEHPVQIRVRRVLSDLTDSDLANAPTGVDGCGIPVTGISLKATAYAMARFADPDNLGDARAAIIRRIHTAITDDPFLVAGSDRFCTRIMQITGADVLVKTGAEGFFCAAIPARNIGVALKIDDGAKRASEVVMASLLSLLLKPNNETLANRLIGEARQPLTNVSGRVVGDISAVVQI